MVDWQQRPSLCQTLIWSHAKAVVVVGDAPDNMQTPWAQIRGAGGPQGDKQCPEDYQRFDVNVYSQNQMEADLISRQIFRAMRSQGQEVIMVEDVRYRRDLRNLCYQRGRRGWAVSVGGYRPAGAFHVPLLCYVLRGGFVDGR